MGAGAQVLRPKLHVACPRYNRLMLPQTNAAVADVRDGTLPSLYYCNIITRSHSDYL